VQWDAGATNREWYVYDSGGERVLRRSTNSSSTTLTVYAFGLEEHVYSSRGTGQTSTLGGNIQGLQNGMLSVDDFPPIRVFTKTPEMDDWPPMVKIFCDGTGYLGDPQYLANGQVYSLDNRRLYVFQQAGVTDIPVEWAPLEEIRHEIWKFDTQNKGISIFVRP
jgi:hypothetical protein